MPILSKESKTRTTEINAHGAMIVVLVFNFFDRMGINLPLVWVLQ